MGWKGRHFRNWVTLNSGGWLCDEYEIMYEESAQGYGVFGVVGYDDEWRVIWRPNRNHTTDYYIKVMVDRIPCADYTWRKFREDHTYYKTLDEATRSIATRWQDEFVGDKPKRYRPRDSQKRKVYRWEHKMAYEIGGKERLEGSNHDTTMLERLCAHEYLQMFLKSICYELGEEAPELKFRTGGRSSKGGYRIRLLPCHCNQLVLIHELAHVLHRRWGTKTNDQQHQSHGKEFVGIYAYLLIRFGGIDKDEIIGHARFSTVNLLLPERYWNWAKIKRKAA